MINFDVTEQFNHNKFTKFLREFLPYDFIPQNEQIWGDTRLVDGEGGSYILGASESLDLVVFEFKYSHGSDPRVSLTKEVVSFMKSQESHSNALAVFYNPNSAQWRLSLITTGYEIIDGKIKSTYSNPRRFSYQLGPTCKKHTPESMLLKGDRLNSIEDLKSRFELEVVSKEFFNLYREKYADFVEYISGKRFVKVGGKFEEKTTKSPSSLFISQFSEDEKAVRDYVKKLFGRLVFLHYIQKKGWLGVKPNQKWGSGDKDFIMNLFKRCNCKDEFLQRVLEPLFFATLNTDRGVDSFAPESICRCYGEQIRIPYLNGGLFERDFQDRRSVVFPKRLFEELLLFFDTYNFTIDESDPSEKEIGIDPEMLGKIFENLLEDNKDKGAFYTPKEIVQYMCRESLIAYLVSKAGVCEDRIREFVTNLSVDFSITETEEIKKALKNVKICDPAVGSGAFPMGMMNELLACRLALNDNYSQQERAQLKKEIIKNNIYGVDIEKGAVDIARLRFWLAIIVDEDNPVLLPNLDYKIMQGNSLLESYKGIDLSKLVQKDEDNCLFDTQNSSDELMKLVNDFFEPASQENKDILRDNISKAALNIIKEKGLGEGRIELGSSGWAATDSIKDINLYANNEFFLWHTWFHDVFNRPNDCNGFDIVIGNPPYVFARDAHFSSSFKMDINKIYFTKLSSGKKTKANQAGKINLFALFILQGVFLMRKNGILSFIVPNNILRTTTYDLVRKYLLDNTSLNQIVDLGSGIFEKVTASTITLMLTKMENSKNNVSAITNVKDLMKADWTCNNIPQQQFAENTSFAFNIFGDEKNNAITRSIEKNTTLFGDYCIDIIEGIVAKKSLIFNEPGKNRFPMLEGKCIKKYLASEINKYIEWNVKEIHRTRPDYLWEQDEKLVTQRISGGANPIVVSYDTEKYKAFASTNNIVLKDEYKHLYKFFLALLNSKVLNWYYANNFSNNSTLTVNISKTYLEQLPIPCSTDLQQKEIIDMVNNILCVKKENPSSDTSEIEQIIEEKIYDLYRLSPEEQKLIEKKQANHV